MHLNVAAYIFISRSRTSRWKENHCARVPEVPPELQRQLVEFIHELRNLDLKKLPAISETIDGLGP